MPQCLEIPEILFHILDHVYLSDKGRSDLARLARTCKLFSSPALDVLWRVQTSLFPLMNTFPPELLGFAPSEQMAVATIVCIPIAESKMAASLIQTIRQSPGNLRSLIGAGLCSTLNAFE